MKLAVGFFDGVHAGHRLILSRANAALTFSSHPLEILAPDRAPALLMTAAERIAAIEDALGGDGCGGAAGRVRAIKFTREFASMAPADFAGWLKREYPGIDTVLCGPNWRFGAGGAGDAAFLRRLGIPVEIVPFEMMDGQTVSSTRIRAAIASGDIPAANRMLGREFQVSGPVEAGKGEGRSLGFPTLNVIPENKYLERLLPFGVYAAETPYGPALANWGKAPTMGEKAWPRPVFEIHILDGREIAPPDSFSARLRLFLRPERRFASLQELRSQIAEDCRCLVRP